MLVPSTAAVSELPGASSALIGTSGELDDETFGLSRWTGEAVGIPGKAGTGIFGAGTLAACTFSVDEGASAVRRAVVGLIGPAGLGVDALYDPTLVVVVLIVAVNAVAGIMRPRGPL